MGILSNRGRHFKRPTLESKREYIDSERDSEQFQWSSRRKHNNRNGNKFLRLLGLFKSRQLHHDNSRGSLPIFTELSRTRGLESNNNTKNDNYTKRHRYNKYIYPVIATVLSVNSLPLQAENVGGEDQRFAGGESEPDVAQPKRSHIRQARLRTSPCRIQKTMR